jgi:hypothetical protein
MHLVGLGYRLALHVSYIVCAAWGFRHFQLRDLLQKSKFTHCIQCTCRTEINSQTYGLPNALSSLISSGTKVLWPAARELTPIQWTSASMACCAASAGVCKYQELALVLSARAKVPVCLNLVLTSYRQGSTCCSWVWNVMCHTPIVSSVKNSTKPMEF